MSAGLPTDRSIDELFDRISKYRTSDTAAVLKAAVARARRGLPNVVDGFPASTGAGSGSGGGPSVLVKDEDGEERIAVTSVESAAMRRMGGRQPDPLNEAVERCLKHLMAAVTSLDLLSSAVAGLGNVAMDAADMNDRRCWVCARAGIEHGHDLKRVRVGDVAFDVCQWAYKFFLDVGALPSPQQCRTHDERGYTRRVVDPTDTITIITVGIS